MNNIILLLKEHIPIKQCENNKKIWISKECICCSEIGRRIFRYNKKLKVGKCYNCGFSFKEYTKLKEHINYYKWLKDKQCMDYRRFEKFEVLDNLPF